MATRFPERSNLVCAFEGLPPENEKETLRLAVETLRNSRQWVIGPPVWVEEVSPVPAKTTSADEPLVTVGALLIIPKGELSRSTERAAFEDVDIFLETMRGSSEHFETALGVELDDNEIGWIERGKFDHGISEGLLGEWARVIRELGE